MCRRLRAQGVDTPILMVTARDAVGDRVRGLDTGADDYLVKPFAFDEVVARLRALTRRGRTRSLSAIADRRAAVASIRKRTRRRSPARRCRSPPPSTGCSST